MTDEGLDNDFDGYPGTDCQGNVVDCDDNTYWISPGWYDPCGDGIDINCDGLSELDEDGDGYPNCYDCNECDDANPAVFPGAAETCDGTDENCNGTVDEANDLDYDGYPELDCAGNFQDCDDQYSFTFPGAFEHCDGLDNNCDGLLDFDDSDGDGFIACQECNDADPAISPAAFDGCDGVDNNCDGLADDVILISSIATGAQTCPVLADGSISIVAQGVGQLRYSIDGGNMFQADGTFFDLPPGTYQVVVEINNSLACSELASVTVDASQAQVLTWKKDLDGDGFTDGGTQQACQQPAGYVLTAAPGDCNDNNPLQFPGQIWFRDADGDGYSNGSTKVQCTKPNGYQADAQLLATSGDCDDAVATTHPGAPEICNDVDDDCDFAKDEGAPVGGTFMGNVTLTSQAQVNSFASCFTVIQGNLTIQNSGVNNLTNLLNLTQVTGNLTIKTRRCPTSPG